MRLVLLFVLLASSAAALDRTAKLIDGTSPDRRLRVHAAQTADGIIYELVRARDGAVLHSIRSSYQPEDGEMPDWSWKHAADAEIHWSPDSHYVLVDEQVHNYIGEVFIVSVFHDRAATVRLPETEILACTGLHWDRHRIRVDRFSDFAGRRVVAVSLAGTVPSGALPDGRTTYEHRSFDIKLRLSGRRAIISSCRDATKEA